LYAWYDGADFAGYGSLPGLGHWRPLFMLFERCLQWQESWDLGFGPWWVPISLEDYGQTVFAVDASGDPDGPAPVVFFDNDDGIAFRADSITEFVGRMIDAVARGAFRATDGAGIEPTDQRDPVRAILADSQPDAQDEPIAESADERFTIPQRFDHARDEIPGGRRAHLDRAVTAMRSLIELGADTRDGLAAAPAIRLGVTHAGRLPDDAHDAAVANAAGMLRLDLDMIWRMLDHSLGAGPWQRTWSDAEADLIAACQS
jgi:hypothetical protein